MISKPMAGAKLNSFDSILDYLREPPTSEVAAPLPTSTATMSISVNKETRSRKGRKKEKEQEYVEDLAKTNSNGCVERLASGHIKYGPIVVHPRKKPAKTLHTGRRSKDEGLFGEEDEKRRIRRERNRIAATKCRQKRDDVLNCLENQYKYELKRLQEQETLIKMLESRKQQLELLLSDHMYHGQSSQPNPSELIVSESTLSYDDVDLHLSTATTSIEQLHVTQHTDPRSSYQLDGSTLLTNSSFHNNQPNEYFNFAQEQRQTATITTSSLERLLDSISNPKDCIDNNNNNTCSTLFNSAYRKSEDVYKYTPTNEFDGLMSS